MPETIKLDVRVLLIQEEGRWVAQCLEYDVAAQADSIKAVKQAFFHSLASQACVNLAHGKKAMEDIPSAPAFYEKRFKEALQLAQPMQDMPTPPKGKVNVQVKQMAIAA